MPLHCDPGPALTRAIRVSGMWLCLWATAVHAQSHEGEDETVAWTVAALIALVALVSALVPHTEPAPAPALRYRALRGRGV